MDRLVEYVGNHPWLAGAAVLMALVVVVYEVRARANAFAALSPQDVIRLMNQGALLLDVRPQALFAQGHINGARHVPSDEILKAGETLKKYKEKTVVVYDETGSVGPAATRQLVEQGFKQAFNLRGGLTAWRGESLPVTKAAVKKG